LVRNQEAPRPLGEIMTQTLVIIDTILLVVILILMLIGRRG
jgi:hypothetical protein